MRFLLLLLIQVLIINCGDYDFEDFPMPDIDEISALLKRRLDAVCVNIKDISHSDKKARLYGDLIYNAVPVKEFQLEQQRGLFKTGSRGLVHFLIDEYDYKYNNTRSDEEFEDYCIKFTRNLVKKFGL